MELGVFRRYFLRLKSLQSRLPPGTVRIICRYFLRQPCGVRPQILLQDVAVLIDEKCHHPGRFILCGICQKGESSRHPAIADVPSGSTGSMFALRRKNPIDLPMKWDRLATFPFAISFGNGPSDQRADRAFG